MNEKERFLVKVWPMVVDFFNRFGPSNYDGFLGSKEQGWHGPYVWSENGDALRLITRFCEDEFGFLNVHNESRIDKFRFANFSAGEESRESIDIDVTDASNCKDYHEFRELTHTMFIEVKEIFKGSIFRGWEKKIEGFKKDCEKLQHQVWKGRCKYAITILIDDGDLNGKPYIIDRDKLIGKLKSKYPDVEPLIWQKG